MTNTTINYSRLDWIRSSGKEKQKTYHRPWEHFGHFKELGVLQVCGEVFRKIHRILIWHQKSDNNDWLGWGEIVTTKLRFCMLEKWINTNIANVKDLALSVCVRRKLKNVQKGLVYSQLTTSNIQRGPETMPVQTAICSKWEQKSNFYSKHNMVSSSRTNRPNFPLLPFTHWATAW